MNKTLNLITEVVRNAMNEEAKNHNLFNLVREVLVKWDGKKLNKRVRDQVAAKLPASMVVFYEPATSLPGKIGIWGKALNIEFENRFTVYFNSYDGGIFTIAKFDEENGQVGKHAVARNNERAVDLTALGKLQRAAAAIDAFKAAQVALAEALEDVTDKYAIERATGLRK